MKAVILAGGSGKRLWPLSRELYPKQFMSIDSKHSLLQQTVERVSRYVEDVYIVTNEAQYYYVNHQLEGRVEEENIISEPLSRNTAPAIALACTWIQEKDGGDTLLVLPSDHILSEDFFEVAKKAEACLRGIALFGVTPTYPATGYGYIKPGRENNCGFDVEKFIEKPEQKLAEQLVAEGCLWNSGTFLFDSSTIMEEFRQRLPQIYQYMSSSEDLLNNYHKLPSISIDYGIIEKSKSLTVVPFTGVWSDIGSWKSLYEIMDKDENNNALKGKVVTLDTYNSLIWSEDRLTAAVGIKDLIAVSTKDALLIAPLSRAEQVKELVEKLKKEHREEVLQHTTVYRQWGYYTVLERGPLYKVKRLAIYPEKSISHQIHHHRAEHWIVVSGTAKVVKDGEETYLHENESIYVPKSTPHKIENPGKIDLHIIEVQTGTYLEEDDIIRFE
jgi:mannose-1-phosphate guanylyltransferase/mannose-6-phosphate isomerase